MQLMYYLERLKKPSVIISIASQIATLLLLFNIEVEEHILVQGISALFTIVTVLGIVSNPDSKNKWYSDDIAYCSNCNKMSKVVSINGKLICITCGEEIDFDKTNIRIKK